MMMWYDIPQAVFGGFTNGDWNATNADGLRDVAAVKLHGDSGDELWRYQSVAADSSQSEGVGLNVSYVSAVSVDGDDNVLLVGSTFNSLEGNSNVDYLAIKLLGETGDEVWRVHGGSASAREGLEGAQVKIRMLASKSLFLCFSGPPLPLLFPWCVLVLTSVVDYIAPDCCNTLVVSCESRCDDHVPGPMQVGRR